MWLLLLDIRPRLIVCLSAFLHGIAQAAPSHPEAKIFAEEPYHAWSYSGEVGGNSTRGQMYGHICSPSPRHPLDSKPQPNHIKAKQHALKQAPRIVAYCVPITDPNRAKGPNESVAKPGGSGKITKEVAVDQKANPIESAQAVFLSDGDITKSVKVKHISLNPLAAKIGKKKVSSWQTVPYGHRMCTDCFSLGLSPIPAHTQGFQAMAEVGKVFTGTLYLLTIS